MLYQASGSRLSSRTYFTWSDISRSSPWSTAVHGSLAQAAVDGQAVGSPPMAVLTSEVVRDETFERRRASMEALVAELRERTALVAAGGGEKAVERHRSRGKLTARERIDRLVDPGTAFLELNALAAWELYDGDAPSAGIVTGIGVVEGRQCVIVANDATVKGGSYYPLTVKKHLRAQEVARQNRLPCLYLVDSGGAFLPLQAEVFPDRDHFGRIFFNQARLSALGIPQIAVVMGSCTAGGAYVPAMSDETVIVSGTGTIFIGGPPLVKAATGQDVTAEELGGADVHTRRSGVADHYATSDEHALAIAREIVRHLDPPPRRPGSSRLVEEPALDPVRPLRPRPGGLPPRARRTRRDRPHRRRLALPRVQGALRRDARLRLRAHRGLPGRDPREPGRPLRRVVAEGRALHRARLQAARPARLPPEHHRLHGRQGVRGRRHRARRREARHGGRVRGRAEVHGRRRAARSAPGNYAMCGRAYEPRQLWMWPNARISVMGGEQAATVLTMVGDADPDEIRATYEAEGNPYYSTARLWDDGIIDPLDTRRVLALGLAAAANAPVPETTFGVFRM